MDAMLDELKQKLASRPDYVTLSGSGEPTLHSRLGDIIEHIQAMCDVPVAVLTNGSLLWQKEVREELALADVVMPSLDAGDELLFRAVNRPHPEITFERLVSGLEQFRHEFTGQYWLEVLLLAGYTAPATHVKTIAEWIRRIQPDRVQLNTAIRPPAEEFAAPVTRERLMELARLFSPRAEVIAEYHRQGKGATADASQQAILELLSRRPCTEADLVGGLAIRPLEVSKHLASLEQAGRIVGKQHGSRIYFRPAPQPGARATKPPGCNLFDVRGSIKIEPKGLGISEAKPAKHRVHRRGSKHYG
jgi:wyosine [tRNA(Phe)-imidazoG37] synthetase (radical SAM superfamily)